MTNESIKKKIIHDYWRKRLHGDCPELKLPVFPNPGHSRPTGAVESQLKLSLTPEGSNNLLMVSRGVDTALFILGFGVLDALLHRYTMEEDVWIGSVTPMEKGGEPEFLLLRQTVPGSIPLKEFMGNVKARVLEDFKYLDGYRFQEISQLLKPDEPGRFFQVAFIYRGFQYRCGHLKKIPLRLEMSKTGENQSTRLLLEAVYHADVYEESVVRRFLESFVRLLESFKDILNVPIRDLEILSGHEKDIIIDHFNRTRELVPASRTLQDLFKEQAQKTPDRVAVCGPVSLTYRQLDCLAEEWARNLKVKGLGPGTIAALQAQRSVEMIIAILAILKTGASYLPVSPDVPSERLEFMLADCAPALTVKLTGIDDTTVLSCPVIAAGSGFSHCQPAVEVEKESGAAYIIYTSGTTGKPKGVIVDHKNAVNTVSWFAREYVNPEPLSSHVLLMADYTFDPSVNQVFGTLSRGGTIHLIGKDDMLDMDKLYRYIHSRQINVLNSVPLLLNDLLSDQPLLPSVRYVLTGGEKLDEKIKNAIRKKGYTLINQYGPTETTIDALAGPCGDGPVTLGRPIANVRCFVLDAHMNPAPIGVPAELYISGPGVARGYLNRVELTNEKFVSVHRSWLKAQGDKNNDSGNGPVSREDMRNRIPAHSVTFYRTGDRVRWLLSGEIEFLGRLDHQVKIRGFRIELGEIEERVLAFPGVKHAVVTIKETITNEPAICAYLVSQNVDADKIKKFLGRFLPPYMIPEYIVPIEQVPKLPSGKIDFKGLPDPQSQNETTFIAPRNRIERELVEIWTDILRIEKGTLGVGHNVFHLGAHSLIAVRAASMMQRLLNAPVTLGTIIKYPTVEQLTRYIEGTLQHAFTTVQPSEKKEYYPLSSAQKRMYILAQVNFNSVAYNMPFVCRMTGDAEPVKLESAFKQLIQRHESFRTSIRLVHNEPVQYIHQEARLDTGFHDCAGADETEIARLIQSFIKPFNLNQPPLVRMQIVETVPGERLFFMDMHHIVSDGGSFQVFIQDFLAFYTGSPVPPLRIQYRDYACWQTVPETVTAIKKQGAYWFQRLQGFTHEQYLPLDRSRDSRETCAASEEFRLDNPVAIALRTAARRAGVTLYMMCLALLEILLSRISGKEDIVVGTPVAGRNHPDFEKVIGIFINTLVMRNNPRKDLTFYQFLQQVKENTAEAFENQDYPFEELVDSLHIQRDALHNPLFDIMFVFGTRDPGKPAITEAAQTGSPGFSVEPYPLDSSETKFDMLFSGSDTGDSINFIIEYNARLFEKKTILRFIDYFNDIIKSIIKDNHIKLNHIAVSHQTVAAGPGIYLEDDEEFGF